MVRAYARTFVRRARLARAVLVMLYVAIPRKLHFDASVFVGVNLYGIGALKRTPWIWYVH